MGGIAEYELVEGDDGGNVLVLSGPFLVSTIGQVDHDLRALDGQITKVDLSAISEIDTVGAWVACSISREFNADLTGASPRAERLIEALKDTGSKEEIGAPRLPVFERVPEAIGQKMLNARKGVYGVVGFLGALLLSIGSLIRHPKRFRWLALVRQLELVGISALPIVGLMSFLIGIVIAQQGAVQLAQFGAETLTVNLVGRITLRELGVLMTAIMVAGRSGSAFAAQIGTMRLTEEVDAMQTIGISPMEALVVPRIMAAVLMMPLLGFYAAAVAIIGGAVVGQFMLGIPFWTFLSRIQDVVPIYDLWVGLLKAPVFGLIVALAGCYHGMQVKGNSEDVGLRTTMAVVTGIFAVIVIDAFFAVFFTKVGWA
ncbi:MAG: ABC transporter permease [Citromicrobium sp.]|jgi:phospholipid/cholesterol/gamma-HCH transport system permease protein|uniref:ABC transporter permease n=1 Tax=Qipengyuania pacifica TaxID=2860199 RepID=A0ABS7JET8_9SPHN|nr:MULTISPECIES: ABC transporter permease [Erythrobacteraceae]MAB44786.1 ABC transporter permease [Sphingomonadaceae bacterium]MAG41615.1 ABC transporter permease [Erythrobacteraceae bacterium]MBV01337.1 ABC transporter permease [Citromicrobium sp.]MCH2496237.1 ABC transporter permease [Erythrobacter sp.]MEC7952396.1 ABC transporter permease [Pseudomonadota bacterium]QPL39501.1 ABC transporter permease [Erythrobacter sp. A30-3]|tara:strand:- start:2982 stop:4094 length:1113 start_codon:yes stop_codon:yes gene_type:complete